MRHFQHTLTPSLLSFHLSSTYPHLYGGVHFLSRKTIDHSLLSRGVVSFGVILTASSVFPYPYQTFPSLTSDPPFASGSMFAFTPPRLALPFLFILPILFFSHSHRSPVAEGYRLSFYSFTNQLHFSSDPLPPFLPYQTPMVIPPR